MNKLYIVDAMGYIFRSYHAIRGMTNPKGQSTNALFGFVRSVEKLIQDFGVENCVVIFDGPRNEESRKKLYSDYKANRGETPKDLLYQFDWAKMYCELKGLSMLCHEGVEADDTIASVALWAKDKGTEVFLCSTDKDLCQIVGDGIKVLNTFKENLIIDEKGVETQFGVPPKLIGDYLAIVGDSSDNVPGVQGIGPKGAVDLLTNFGSLEAVLENAANIKGKKGQVLSEQADMARLSRQLVELDTHIPFEESSFALGEENREGLKEFFLEHNFNSLLKSVTEEVEETVDYRLVSTKEQLIRLVKLLDSEEVLAVDTETTSEDPMRAELVGIGLGRMAKEAWYIPTENDISREELLEILTPLFEAKRWVGQNIKYDMHVLENFGFPLLNPAFDTMVASYLLNSDQRQHSLDTLSLHHFGKVKTALTSLIGKGKNQITMREVPVEKAYPYACEDIDYTIRLQELFEKELEERKLKNLFDEIEMPLVPVLSRMEKRGIFVDKQVLAKLSKELTAQIAQISEEIYELAGDNFNLNSPKQLSQILYEKLEIKPLKKGKSAFSTGADILEQLKWAHPIIEKVLSYRQLEKLRSTYIDTLPGQINPKTGRVHCTFNQSVAATGRLSAQNPNLQNIPVRSELGREIRAAFRPEKENWVYLSADYSQIELRLLAHLSEDPLLLEAFKKGEDIHRATAAAVFDVMPGLVTKEMRGHAKAVNFGIVYGQQAWGLSQELGISQKDAQKFIDQYFTTYPGVKSYVEEMKSQAKKEERVLTLFGRERRLAEINSQNPNLRQMAERLAINSPLQGSNADLIKIAMIKIDKKLRKENMASKMLLQIHDELLFELPESEIEILKVIVKEIMEGVVELKVPLVVDMVIGKNWKEC